MAAAAATGKPGDRLYAAAVLQRQRAEERKRLQVRGSGAGAARRRVGEAACGEAAGPGAAAGAAVLGGGSQRGTGSRCPWAAAPHPPATCPCAAAPAPASRRAQPALPPAPRRPPPRRLPASGWPLARHTRWCRGCTRTRRPRARRQTMRVRRWQQLAAGAGAAAGRSAALLPCRLCCASRLLPACGPSGSRRWGGKSAGRRVGG
jgi:hypothetical protein